MKKIIAILMVFIMVLSLVALTACSGNGTADVENAALKLGLGVTTTVTTKDATEDANGQGQATTTAAAVLVDDAGKIVKAFIDCADHKVGYTFDGKAVANESFKTKYEQGASYNMVLYGGAAKEWFEQADAFCALIVGKTASEVKALVAENAKGTDEVINAGCTIYVSDFAVAVEEAINNATASNATKNDTLKLGVSTTQTTSDATEDKPGSNKLETTFFAAAVNAESKIVAASSDCVQVEFKFDDAGKSSFDTTKEVLSKKEQGANYNMVLYGGAKKEWFEQAAAFDALCVGKTVTEIKGFMGADYKGNTDVQAAGCTIYVSGFVAAASKIG